MVKYLVVEQGYEYNDEYYYPGEEDNYKLSVKKGMSKKEAILMKDFLIKQTVTTVNLRDYTNEYSDIPSEIFDLFKKYNWKSRKRKWNGGEFEQIEGELPTRDNWEALHIPSDITEEQWEEINKVILPELGIYFYKIIEIEV